jgi:hypothetical protein
VIFDAGSYALDDDGNRILIGLTVEETREVLDLTDLLATINPGQSLSSIDWTSPKEKRWLALMQKHAGALEKLARARRTKH